MANITFISFFDMFSIGSRIMASYLRKSGHVCNTIYFKYMQHEEIDVPRKNTFEMLTDGRLRIYLPNLFCTRKELGLLIGTLKSHRPDIIGVSNRSPLDRFSLPVIESIKQELPTVLIVAGGFGPMLNPDLYLNVVDYVAFGEGEETILEMADSVESGKPMDKIDNLIFLRHGQIVKNSVRKPADPIDLYPLPEFDNEAISYIDEDQTFNIDPMAGQDGYYILTSRGCIGRCTYCSQSRWKTIYAANGHRLRPIRNRSISSIMEELESIKDRFSRIIFLNDYLTGTRKYLLTLFKEYKRRIDLPFTANLYACQIEKFPEILNSACDAGLDNAVLGIQHGDQDFCHRLFDRNVSNRTLHRVAEMYHQREIKTRYDFIAGIPSETKQTLTNSLQFVKTLPMAHAIVNVSRLAVYPHSPLEEQFGRVLRNPSDEDPINWYFTSLLYYFRTIFDDPTFEKLHQIVLRSITGDKENHTRRVKKLFREIIKTINQSGETLLQSPLLRLPLFYRTFIEDENALHQALKKSGCILLEEFFKGEFVSIDPRLVKLPVFTKFIIEEIITNRITVLDSSVDTFDLYKEYACQLNGQPIVVWGTGGGYDRLKDVFAQSHIQAFLDNDPSKQGRVLDSIPIHPPSYLENRTFPVFICSAYKEEIFHQIQKDYPHISIIP